MCVCVCVSVPGMTNILQLLSGYKSLPDSVGLSLSLPLPLYLSLSLGLCVRLNFKIFVLKLHLI